MKTRGVRYLKEGGAEIIEVDVPDPGPGEVQLETAACGICALDIYSYRNGSESLLPFIPPTGHEGVSYVRKIGPGVTGFKEGDLVAGGSFARISNVSVAGQVYPLPTTSLAHEHWLVEPVSCVVTGLDLCYLQPGDRVAVIGCGFMGLLLIQGLVHSFAERVVGIDINPDRLALAKQFGANAIYDSSSNDFEKQLPELQSQQFDTVIDTSGTQAALSLAEKLVRLGGRINLFGWIHQNTMIAGHTWHLQGFSVVASSPSAKIRDPFPPAIRLIHSGLFDLRPLVTHVVPLEEYPTLLSRIVNNQASGYIKGVVSFS